MAGINENIDITNYGVGRFKKPPVTLFIDDVTSDILHLHTIDRETNFRHCAELRKAGIVTRIGAWRKAEDALLLKNFHAYLANNQVDNPLRLFNSLRDKKIRKTMKDTNFYSRLCKNLNRTTLSVYNRMKYILLSNCKTGRYTDEEKDQLYKLTAKYGKNYKKIAIIMNRSQRSVNHIYSKSCCNLVKGPWTPKEEEKLFKGLRTVMKCQDLTKLRQQSNIKWREVAKFVGTREGIQCLQHFRNLKTYKFESEISIKPRWTKQNTVVLITNLYNENFDHESDVDWSELNELFTDVSPSATYLQGTFHRLKYGVDDYQRKTFNEIVNCLYDMYCNTSL